MNIILPVSRRWYAMIALVVLLIAPALTAAPELPTLNDPPTHARLPGKFPNGAMFGVLEWDALQREGGK